MKNDQSKNAPLPKLARLASIGLFLVLATIWFNVRLAMGILAGTPVGIFNYWLVTGAAEDKLLGSARRSQAVFLRRALYRWVIDFGALLAASTIGGSFLIGVVIGLALQVFAHMIDALSLSFPHNPQKR